MNYNATLSNGIKRYQNIIDIMILCIKWHQNIVFKHFIASTKTYCLHKFSKKQLHCYTAQIKIGQLT